MAQRKTAVTPWLMQWSYCSLALSHRIMSSSSHLALSHQHAIIRPQWVNYILMAQRKTAVTPLLPQWSYCSQALSHRYGIIRLKWVHFIYVSLLMYFSESTIRHLYHAMSRQYHNMVSCDKWQQCAGLVQAILKMGSWDPTDFGNWCPVWKIGILRSISLCGKNILYTVSMWKILYTV